jgi:predicted glycoside hydrolase/deacetylase ChbG (UPF0249 family)
LERILVCADDYAIAPGVSRAIRRLVASGRIDATSCMTGTPYWPAEGAALRALGASAEIGLHLTLTGPTRSLGQLAALAFAGRLDRAEIAAEFVRQLDLFERVRGGPPDFVDGHQHVHQFPTIRDATLGLWDGRLDRARTWLRVSAAPPAALLRIAAAPVKALALSALGGAMRRAAARAGVRTNAALLGVDDLAADKPVDAFFARTFGEVRPGTVVMCHPGEIDDALAAADGLVGRRAVELAYFEGPVYAALRAR